MTFGLIYGLYSRAASNQERPMMARVQYIFNKIIPVSIALTPLTARVQNEQSRIGSGDEVPV